MNKASVSVEPDTNVLLAMKERELKWEVVCHELADNAFDAGATNITFEYGYKNNVGRCLRVTDNGVGCDDTLDMVRQGRRKDHKTTVSGRYGIGLKAAAVWLWGTMMVMTRTQNKWERLLVTWKKMLESGKWDIAQPGAGDSSNVSTGTTISFTHIDKRYPVNYQKLADKLGYLFAAGLAGWYNGEERTITIKTPRGKTIRVVPYKLPPFEQHIREKFYIDGKEVNLLAGIVSPGECNSEDGLIFTCGFRAIMTSALGCGNYSVQNIAGYVILDKAFGLTQLKQDISEHEKPALEREIFRKMEPLLKLAADKTYALKSEALAEKIGGSLNTAITRLQTGISKGDKATNDTPKKAPTTTNTPAKKLADDVDSSSKKKIPNVDNPETGDDRGRVAVQKGFVGTAFSELGGDTLVKTDLSANRLTFNLSHQFVQEAHKNDAAEVLVSLAAWAYADCITKAEDPTAYLHRHFSGSARNVTEVASYILQELPDMTTKRKKRKK